MFDLQAKTILETTLWFNKSKIIQIKALGQADKMTAS
jgi:hypothetical protein